MHRSLVVLIALVAGCAGAPRDDFSFALIGDLGYTPAQEPMVDRVFAALGPERLAFVVHDGDLGSPSNGSCTDEHWARRLAQFEASPQPLIYTPGDNEWTDCHAGEGLPQFQALERLRALRARFFSSERSFGRQSLALARQAGYPENARWSMGEISFMTLHVVGSNNGRGYTRERDDEVAARTAANIAWMREGFAAAQSSRAVMIIQQANMWPEFPPFPGGKPKEPSGFTELREALERAVVAYGKPVVLVHGDSHYFRIDKPFRARSGLPPIDNFTRVETFGAPSHHWVQVFVNRDDPNVFAFRPRLVEANIQRRSQ
jgi:hypothetical protein